MERRETVASLKPCPFRVYGVHKWERDKKVYDYEERFAECMGARCPAFQIGTGICIRSNGGPMKMTYSDGERTDNG